MRAAPSKRGALVVLVTGDPLPSTQARRGGFAELIRDVVEPYFAGPIVAVDVRSEASLPPVETVSGVVVSGSASSVTERLPWMLRLEEHLCRAVSSQTPVFGICFGHQLLASALGGEVRPNPRGREMGSVHAFRHGEYRGRDLLDSTPETFVVNMTHVDSVTRLPAGARVLARTELEPHALVQFGETAWGAQFHPEVDALVMREYVEGRRDVLEREGFDAERTLADVSSAEAGKAVLERFALVCGALARGGGGGGGLEGSREALVSTR